MVDYPTPSSRMLIGTIKDYGGEGGIRTHGTLSGTAVFETARFNHSRTSPCLRKNLILRQIEWPSPIITSPLPLGTRFNPENIYVERAQIRANLQSVSTLALSTWWSRLILRIESWNARRLLRKQYRSHSPSRRG